MVDHSSTISGKYQFLINEGRVWFQRKIKFPREMHGCCITAVMFTTEMLFLFTDGDGTEHDVFERDTKWRRGGWWLRTVRPTTWNIHSTCGILINPGGRCNWKWNPGVYSVVWCQHEKRAQHIRALSSFGRSFGKKKLRIFRLIISLTIKKVLLSDGTKETEDFTQTDI